LDDLDLFGFTRESVAPFAERAIGAPLRTFASEVRGIDALPGTDEYGVCGEKRIVTFTAVDVDGRERRAEVFVKLANKGCEESAHFVELSRHGAPIPRYYGALAHPDGREAVFSELLDPLLTWNDWNDPDTHDEFVSAIARLNAITLSDGYRRSLTRDHVRRDMNAAVEIVSEAWRLAVDGR
jgi:hypothetical protein